MLALYIHINSRKKKEIYLNKKNCWKTQQIFALRSSKRLPIKEPWNLEPQGSCGSPPGHVPIVLRRCEEYGLNDYLINHGFYDG